MDVESKDSEDTAKKRTKRPRKVLTLKTKLEILKRLEQGETSSSLGRFYSLNESSIRSIKRNADTLKRCMKNSTDLSMKVSGRVRNPLIEKMEKMLIAWIEERNQNSANLTSVQIRQKALLIFNYLRQTQGESSMQLEDFQASKGWFEKFKRRQALQSMKFNGESPSVDQEAAVEFPFHFQSLIDAGGYIPQQVFNMDETVLYWKRLPTNTFISVEEKRASGFKAAKDKLVMILCTNAAGNFRSKPFVVYHSLVPRALKNVNLHTLPVHWRADKKNVINANIVEDWMSNCFLPEVEQYCSNSGIEFHIMLTMDSSIGHSNRLKKIHPNIKVVFLPRNTTSILQPMNQGITDSFKMLYLKQILKEMLENVKDQDRQAIRNFWKSFNIRHSLDIIRNIWDCMGDKIMNAAWENLWTNCIEDFKDFECLESIIDDIVKMACILGFNHFEYSDVKEILNLIDEEPQYGELEELVDDESKYETNDDDNTLEDPNADSSVKRELTVDNLAMFLGKADELIKLSMEIDPNMERSLKVKKKITQAVSAYRDIYKQKMESRDVCLKDDQQCLQPDMLLMFQQFLDAKQP